MTPNHTRTSYEDEYGIDHNPVLATRLWLLLCSPAPRAQREQAAAELRQAADDLPPEVVSASLIEACRQHDEYLANRPGPVKRLMGRIKIALFGMPKPPKPGKAFRIGISKY